MYILAYVYGDDYCNLLCAGESGYSSERELLLYYCSKARESITFAKITNCMYTTTEISIGGYSGSQEEKLAPAISSAFDTLHSFLQIRI